MALDHFVTGSIPERQHGEFLILFIKGFPALAKELEEFRVCAIPWEALFSSTLQAEHLFVTRLDAHQFAGLGHSHPAVLFQCADQDSALILIKGNTLVVCILGAYP